MGKKSTSKDSKETPLMKQYNSIKVKHPDAILLFRVGDFYETFGEDAIKASKVLGIVLTQRKNGAAAHIELAGFPHHSLETYLPKLVRAGYRVAICDQLEDPKKTKKIVKRGITELVTPGVALSDNVLDNKSNNFLASIHKEKNNYGAALLDISTGEFFTIQGNHSYIEKVFQGFNPSEILINKKYEKEFYQEFGNSHHIFTIDDWAFTFDFCYEKLTGLFKTNSLKGFGIEQLNLGIIAAGVIIKYLDETRHDKTDHIYRISRLEKDDFVWMDNFTLRNLELLGSGNESATTLIDIIDQTKSPMGARKLKRWVTLPLKDVVRINKRLDSVQALINQEELKNRLSSFIASIGDLERYCARISVGKVNPKELNQIKNGLVSSNTIKELLDSSSNKTLNTLGDKLNPCLKLIEQINSILVDDPPSIIGKGTLINKGVSNELDELTNVLTNGKDYIVGLQLKESERTGIPKLKVGFNNVFGYYLEVTHTHKSKVPDDWIRKQTLVNAERYITEELKEYESKVLGAEEKIQVLETQLYQELIDFTKDYIKPILLNAGIIAELDCLLSFADVSIENYYTRPQIHDGDELKIKGGRHPVIEKQLPIDEPFITNDIYLSSKQQQILMITGPNMSGKSAILRQTALIVLMGQIGCFVPAKEASFGYIDKIFTRVGASDNISVGESTFMVEMNETSSILNNLSNRSLILLDEIGRGTSTYDGISIAWAIAEFIHENKFKAKTLFATHYHELNDMASNFDRIKNFNVSVKEVNNSIVFLRKLVAGGSEHSFGIHVAKLAGMPQKVILRSNEILTALERKSNTSNKNVNIPNPDNFQLSFFQLDDPTLAQIKDEIIKTDINTLTPIEALMKLNDIKKLVGG